MQWDTFWQKKENIELPKHATVWVFLRSILLNKMSHSVCVSAVLCESVRHECKPLGRAAPPTIVVEG